MRYKSVQFRASLETRDALVLAHLSLIPPIARQVKRLLPRQFDIEDLESAGKMGLIEAAASYDPAYKSQKTNNSGPIPFDAYARPRIRGSMIDSARRGAYADAQCLSLHQHPRWADIQFEMPTIDADIDRERRAASVRKATAELQPKLAAVVAGVMARQTLAEIGRGMDLGKRHISLLKLRAIETIREQLEDAA